MGRETKRKRMGNRKGKPGPERGIAAQPSGTWALQGALAIQGKNIHLCLRQHRILGHWSAYQFPLRSVTRILMGG